MRGAHFYSTATGAVSANGTGAAPHSQRLRPEPGLPTSDSAFIQFYRIDADSTGHLAPFRDVLVTNMAIGAPSGEVPQGLRWRVWSLPRTTSHASMAFSSGSECRKSAAKGSSCLPLGVVNAASFAPPTYPVSGGTLISAFGSGLATAAEQAQAIPLPTNLGGVSVTVNGVAAPLLFVSGEQINLQVPFGASGSSATIVVNNNGTASNEVAVPLAASSPGIFSVDGTGFGPGTFVHADFSLGLVSEAAPAAPERHCHYLSHWARRVESPDTGRRGRPRGPVEPDNGSRSSSFVRQRSRNGVVLGRRSRLRRFVPD